MRRIRCLLLKELAQLRRDHRLFGILIIAPAIQVLVFGFALNTDVRDISLAVRDNDHSWHSREFVRALGASGYFHTTMISGPEQNDANLLISSRAGLVVTIPPDFGKRLTRRQPASVQALVDGADSNFGVQGLNYLQKASRQFSEGLVKTEVVPQLAQSGLHVPAVAARTRVWFNPDLRSRFYMVPALMGQLLMITTMMVSSMSLIKEREEGTLEQMIVTPLRSLEIIAGKLLPYVVVGFVEVNLILPVLIFVFAIPFNGSLAVLYEMSGLFLMTTLGLGLLISTLVRTQQQAMLVSSFFIMMPFVMLSGFAFPVENMPEVIQWVTYAIPLKYYMIIVRAIFLKGAGWPELWPHALALLISGIVILGLAVMKFRKRLD